MILKTSEMPFTLPYGVMFVNLCKKLQNYKLWHQTSKTCTTRGRNVVENW